MVDHPRLKMELIVAACSLAITTVATTAAAVAYLSRHIEKRVSFDLYDKKHTLLEDRVRKLETWAASKNGPDY